MKKTTSNITTLRFLFVSLLFITLTLHVFAQRNEKKVPIKTETQKESVFRDTGIDESFSPQLQPFALVSAADIQEDGKIIIGGKFKLVNETSTEVLDRIVRLNSDGSIDKTFSFEEPLAWNSEHPVSVIKIQPDGKILVAKDWRIIRLNPNGTNDSSFQSLTFSSYGSVDFSDIQIYPDGRILVTGYYRIVNGALTSNITRLNYDGTIDETFHFGNAISTVFIKAGLQSDGKILIAVANQNWYEIGLFPRLNPDGEIDSTFRWSKTQYDYKRIVHQESFLKGLILEKNGNIIISGKISNNGFLWNEDINGVYRLNPDGYVLNSFEHERDYHSSIFQQEDEKIIALSYGGSIEDGSNLVRFFPNGKQDTSFRHRILFYGSNYPNRPSVLIQKNGKVLVHGSFREVNGVSSFGIVRLN